MRQVLTYRNQTIDCFGEWNWDSNCLVFGEYADGTEMEYIHAHGADSWEDVVQKLVDYLDEGDVIYELTAC